MFQDNARVRSQDQLQHYQWLHRSRLLRQARREHRRWLQNLQHLLRVPRCRVPGHVYSGPYVTTYSFTLTEPNGRRKNISKKKTSFINHGYNCLYKQQPYIVDISYGPI